MPNPEFEPVETVLIPTAGAGSRLLSMTSYVEKALLPINFDQPVVNYSIEDAVRGGAKHIIFVVTKRGEQQLTDKYGKKLNSDTAAQLLQVNKGGVITDEEASRLSNHDVEFDYIIQPAEGEYGTTVPLSLAEAALKGIKRFGVFMGDDLTYNQRRISEFGLAVQDLAAHPQADHLAMGSSVEPEDAGKYGVFIFGEDRMLQKVIEHPKPKQVPLDPVMNISKYVFKDNIWVPVHETMTEKIPKKAKGERQLTRTITLARGRGQTFVVHPLSEGTVYLDGGTADGLRETSDYVRTHPQDN